MPGKIEWRYRAPSVKPWWRPLALALVPICEFLVLGLALAAAYCVALLLAVL